MKQLNSVLLYDKFFAGEGKVIIKKFIKEFQDTFGENICQYARLSKSDQCIEHLFWYGEQQLKTAVTTALSKTCNGYIMQEPGVSRKIIKCKKIATDYKNGRVDYWCRIGKATKISVLIEVKQAWIRYYTPEKWTLYKYALNTHESAIRQVHNIEKSDFIWDHLYGIALTVLPIFSRHDSADENEKKMNRSTLNLICTETINNKKIHACGGFEMPDELNHITEWSDNNRKKIYESYPGLIFIWSIYKFTKRKR